MTLSECQTWFKAIGPMLCMSLSSLFVARMHVYLQVIGEPDISFFLLDMETFAQFAERKIIFVLCKERAKCCRKNKSQHDFSLPEDDMEIAIPRKFLSCIMPPRSTWMQPRPQMRAKRFTQKDGRLDLKRMHRYAIQKTIERDRKLQQKGKHFPYLERLDRFLEKFLEPIRSNNLAFDTPQLNPLHKSTKYAEDGHRIIVYRPLSIYAKLNDKLIIALASMYLARYFNSYLHPNILSYRPPRPWRGERRHVTDFNDGIKAIATFRERHANETIYASDCDIQKFYDTLQHDMVRKCVSEMLSQRNDLSEEGKRQIMSVIDAYLNSYNFYEHALMPSKVPGFWYPFYKRHRCKENDECRFDWIDTDDRHIGVPQGGALSLNIANIVLNHVDHQAGLTEIDPKKLFLRFCDDMILLHTDKNECERLMQNYCQALTDHQLHYHPMQDIRQAKKEEKTQNGFWNQKSHSPFLWAEGEGNCNRYIGFLGYEMRRDGQVRLRKSNELKWSDKLRNYTKALFRKIQSAEMKNGGTLTKEQMEDITEKAAKQLRSLEQGRDFYLGFNWEDAENYDVRQWVHIHQREKRMLRLLRAKLKKIDAERYQPLIHAITEMKNNSILPSAL